MLVFNHSCSQRILYNFLDIVKNFLLLLAVLVLILLQVHFSLFKKFYQFCETLRSHQIFTLLFQVPYLVLDAACNKWLEGIVDFLTFAGRDISGSDLVLEICENVLLLLLLFFFLLDILIKIFIVVLLQFLIFHDFFDDLLFLFLLYLGSFLCGPLLRLRLKVFLDRLLLVDWNVGGVSRERNLFEVIFLLCVLYSQVFESVSDHCQVNCLHFFHLFDLVFDLRPCFVFILSLYLQLFGNCLAELTCLPQISLFLLLGESPLGVLLPNRLLYLFFLPSDFFLFLLLHPFFRSQGLRKLKRLIVAGPFNNRVDSLHSVFFLLMRLISLRLIC